MANTVLMPQIGISEESAILTEWKVKKGDSVKAGDILFSIETGKSSFDVESEYSGVVLDLLVSEGDEAAVKSPVCIIGDAGNGVPGGGVSPRARKLAEKNDVDPKSAVPTGPEGRVIERDVRALLINNEEVRGGGVPRAPVPSAPAPASAYTEQPLSNMRKTIAKTMMASLQNTAQLTHTSSFDATNILEYRKILKNDAKLSGVTLTDMVLYAVTRTLPEFPALNAWLTGDTMRVFSDVNLACAVDTERGLMVPVIFGASKKTLSGISRELKSLAEQCRAGNAASESLTGGSFTVSNLGQYGVESFTPILNPPQTGILGVNAITWRVRQDGGAYPCMALSLTYDHRALDGAPASKFLQTLCKNLENFTALLAR